MTDEERNNIILELKISIGKIVNEISRINQLIDELNGIRTLVN